MSPAEPIPRFAIREVLDSDSAALVELIDSCYREYPGCVMDPEGEDADLAAPRSAFSSHAGTLWVVSPMDSGELIACAGIRPADAPETFELKRMYVARRARRRGIAAALFTLIERTARERGGHTLILWSDTRFADAHRFYESRGCARGPGTRELHDPSSTTEFFYSKPLR